MSTFADWVARSQFNKLIVRDRKTLKKVHGMERILYGVSRLLFSIIMALPSSAAIAAASAEQEDSTVGLNVKLGYDRTNGKYDQSTNSTASTSSVTVAYDTDDYSFDLVVPYLRQSGPGRLVAIAGQRGIVTIGPDQRASGLGDVTAGLTRYVLNEEDHGVDLDLGTVFKFHTASVSKGLGSGKSDLAIQTALGRSFGALNTTLTLGYTFVGKPPDQGYRNAYYASMDGTFKITERVSLGITYAAGGSIINGLPGTRDITANVNFKPTKKFKLNAYYSVGRSTQSPDRGAGITASRDF